MQQSVSAQQPACVPLLRFLETTGSTGGGGGIFTFSVPVSLVRGFVEEIVTSPFEYHSFRWRLRLIRTQLHVGAFIELSTRMENSNSRIYIDYTLTVINQEHFSKNQSFSRRNVCFNNSSKSHGDGCFVEASDLCERHFVFEDGHFLLELEIAYPVVNICIEIHKHFNDFKSEEFTLGEQNWHLKMFHSNTDDNRIVVQCCTEDLSENAVLCLSFACRVLHGLTTHQRLSFFTNHDNLLLLASELSSEISCAGSNFNLLLCDLRLQRFSGLRCRYARDISVQDCGNFTWVLRLNKQESNLDANLQSMENLELIPPNHVRVIGWSLHQPSSDLFDIDDVLKTQFLNRHTQFVENIMTLYNKRMNSREQNLPSNQSEQHSPAREYVQRKSIILASHVRQYS